MLVDNISTFFNDCLKDFFPGICLLCKGRSNAQLDLCEACEITLPYLKHACLKCAFPLPINHTSQMCGTCLTQKEQSSYRIFSPFIYQFPIDRLIMALKFKQQINISKVLGHLMATQMKTIYQNRDLPDAIIPMPLHVQRLRERGFNQALELAKPISHLLNIPIDHYSCTRIRYTQPQIDLPRKARSHNVKGAFAVSKHFHLKRVCLIDDVVTTGQTALALNDVLFKAGVQFIDIWCCARSSLKAPMS